MKIESNSEYPFEAAVQIALARIQQITIPSKSSDEIMRIIGDTFGLEKDIAAITAKTIGAIPELPTLDIQIDRMTPIRTATDEAEGRLYLEALSESMTIDVLLKRNVKITNNKRVAEQATFSVLTAAIDAFLDENPDFADTHATAASDALRQIDNGVLLQSHEKAAYAGDSKTLNRKIMHEYLMCKLEEEGGVSNQLDRTFLRT